MLRFFSVFFDVFPAIFSDFRLRFPAGIAMKEACENGARECARWAHVASTARAAIFERKIAFFFSFFGHVNPLECGIERAS